MYGEDSLISLLTIYFALVNLYGFLMMFIDKRKAIKSDRRIPEKTLFTIAASGGALGVFLGMYTFKHKTLHASFAIGIPALFFFNLFCIYMIYKYAY